MLLLSLIWLTRFTSDASQQELQDVSREASYIIFKRDALCYAMNTVSGETPFAGADDSLVLTNALNSLPPCGGKIFLSAGSYVLNSTIVLDKACVIEGEGSGRSYLGNGIAQLNFGNMTAFKIASSGVKICNLQLRGMGKTEQLCCGIYLDALSAVLNQNIVIEDVMIVDVYYGVYGAGIHDIWDLRLYDVYINHCNQGIRIDKNTGAVQLQTRHVFIAHADSDAVYLTRADAIVLDTIFLVEPRGNGIVIASFGSYPLMIRNCQIDECHQNGILIDLNDYCSLWLTITDTEIKAHKSAIYVKKAQDILIMNCHMAASERSMEEEPIVFVGDTHRVQISNCLIKNLGRQTRNCVELFDSRYCHIANCQVDHSVGAAVNIDYGIKETGTLSNANQIVHNTCVGISKGAAYTYGVNSISAGNI